MEWNDIKQEEGRGGEGRETDNRQDGSRERLREIKWKIERKEAQGGREKAQGVYVQSLGISP